eukprot:6302714-Amphidinium_carterae.1
MTTSEIGVGFSFHFEASTWRVLLGVPWAYLPIGVRSPRIAVPRSYKGSTFANAQQVCAITTLDHGDKT